MRKTKFADDASRPVLLVLSKETKEKEEFQNLIIFLLRHSLAIELTRDLTIQEIRSWINFVDKEQSFYKTLAQIFWGISKTKTEQNRICSYLSMWSKTSNTAIELLMIPLIR